MSRYEKQWNCPGLKMMVGERSVSEERRKRNHSGLKELRNMNCPGLKEWRKNYGPGLKKWKGYCPGIQNDGRGIVQV